MVSYGGAYEYNEEKKPVSSRVFLRPSKKLLYEYIRSGATVRIAVGTAVGIAFGIAMGIAVGTCVGAADGG